MAQALYHLDAPRRLHRRTHVLTAVGALGFALIVVLATANGATRLGPVPAFVLAYSLVGSFVAGVTSLLMFGHARVSHRRGYLMVAGTFLYTTVLTAALPMFFTGAIVPDQQIWGSLQSAVNLVYAWHLVLPIGVTVSALMIYIDQRRHRRPSLSMRRLILGAGISIAAALLTIAIADSGVLPAVLTAGGVRTPYAMVTSVVLVLVTVVCAVISLWCAANGSVIGRWLAACNVLMVGVAVIRLGSADRYSLAWYSARMLWGVCATLLLIWLMVSLLRVDRHNTRMAVVDSLTGAESRISLMEAIHRELARVPTHGGDVALLWVDLDGFKGVNDQHGHQIGDFVLRTTADRLSAQVRVGDHVGRLGGDEFGVLLCDDVAPQRVTAVADRLLASIREPIRIGDTLLHVTGAVGIATAPADASRTEDLLLCADLAMYAAKNRGGDRYERFNARIGTEAVGKARLRHDLASSLRHGEFCLYYQPIYEADGLRMAGVEVLARWLRNGIAVPAGEFVPFAEESGQIIPLGRIVISQLARELPRWLAGHDDSFFVCLNVSVKELADRELVDGLLSAPFLERPDQLVIEVTESLELQENSEAEASLDRLRGHGVRIAIDDFGAGFSNFTRLEHLRPSLLKVDRSLVRRAGSENEGGVAFLTAATSVAASLNCDVVAEGVETQAEAQVVGLLGVRYVQGFRYSKPAPIEAFLESSVK